MAADDPDRMPHRGALPGRRRFVERGRPMRVMRLIGAVFVAALTLSVAARAAELDLPGLARDSEADASELRKIAPAGATAAVRQRDEQRALDAADRKDWSAA